MAFETKKQLDHLMDNFDEMYKLLNFSFWKVFW